MEDEQTTPEPNVTGEGYTQIILPTEMLLDMGRRLKVGQELTQAEKNELLSAIMRAIG